MKNIIDILFPPSCIYCKEVGSLICHTCLTNCELNILEECIVCQKGSKGGDTHKECKKSYTPDGYFNIFKYDGIIRDSIRKAKYGRMEFAYLKNISEHGVKMLDMKGFSIQRNMVLVPIPLNKSKFRKRGFNQARIICRVISSKYKLRIKEKLITRVVDTKPQHSNDKRLRHTNVLNAFRADTKDIQEIVGKRMCILLVDDICTSGATFIEATRAIKLVNSRVEVYCLSLAKGTLRIK